MTTAEQTYIKSLRQCADEWWFTSYQYDGTWYSLTFDSDFELVCVNREIRQDNISRMGEEVSADKAQQIYQAFLESIQ